MRVRRVLTSSLLLCPFLVVTVLCMEAALSFFDLDPDPEFEFGPLWKITEPADNFNYNDNLTVHAFGKKEKLKSGKMEFEILNNANAYATLDTVQIDSSNTRNWEGYMVPPGGPGAKWTMYDTPVGQQRPARARLYEHVGGIPDFRDQTEGHLTRT